MPAQVRTPHQARDCVLTNLSEDGAQIYLEEPPRLYADVMLTCSLFETLGSVQWIKGSRCGLMFDEALPKELVLAARSLEKVDPAGEAHAAAAQEWADGTARFNSSD